EWPVIIQESVPVQVLVGYGVEYPIAVRVFVGIDPSVAVAINEPIQSARHGAHGAQIAMSVPIPLAHHARVARHSEDEASFARIEHAVAVEIERPRGDGRRKGAQVVGPVPVPVAYERRVAGEAEVDARLARSEVQGAVTVRVLIEITVDRDSGLYRELQVT